MCYYYLTGLIIIDGQSLRVREFLTGNMPGIGWSYLNCFPIMTCGRGVWFVDGPKWTQRINVVASLSKAAAE